MEGSSKSSDQPFSGVTQCRAPPAPTGSWPGGSGTSSCCHGGGVAARAPPSATCFAWGWQELFAQDRRKVRDQRWPWSCLFLECYSRVVALGEILAILWQNGRVYHDGLRCLCGRGFRWGTLRGWISVRQRVGDFRRVHDAAVTPPRRAWVRPGCGGQSSWVDVGKWSGKEEAEFRTEVREQVNEVMGEMYDNVMDAATTRSLDLWHDALASVDGPEIFEINTALQLLSDELYSMPSILSTDATGSAAGFEAGCTAKPRAISLSCTRKTPNHLHFVAHARELFILGTVTSSCSLQKKTVTSRLPCPLRFNFSWCGSWCLQMMWSVLLTNC